jgi:hypothetical protein
MPMGPRGHGATFCEVPPMTPPSVTELAGPLRPGNNPTPGFTNL